MRKEISNRLKKISRRKKAFAILVLFFIFFIFNIYSVYFIRPLSKYGTFAVTVVPFPAFLVGNQTITVKEYYDQFSLNKRLQENVYKLEIDKSNNRDFLESQIYEQAKKDLIERAMIERLLKNIRASITSKDINKRYEEIVNDIGGADQTIATLKMSAGWTEGDLKSKIYDYLLRQAIEDNFFKKIKIEALQVSIDDSGDQEKKKQSLDNFKSAIDDLRAGKGIDEVKNTWGIDNEALIDNDRYYFLRDLPEEIREQLSSMTEGEVTDPIEKDGAYYAIKIVATKGYAEGSLDDLLTQQKEKMRIIDFFNWR